MIYFLDLLKDLRRRNRFKMLCLVCSYFIEICETSSKWVVKHRENSKYVPLGQKEKAHVQRPFVSFNQKDVGRRRHVEFQAQTKSLELYPF